ncbi:MAG: AEC family transporter [Myxococcota bacterium]
MPDYWTILGLMLPVYGIIAVGVITRRVGILAAEAEQSLTRVLINVLFPCLALDKIVGNAALRDPRNVVIPPAVGFLTVCLGYLVGNLVGRVALRGSDVTRRTFAFTSGTYNYGYVPLPLAMSLFGDATVGVLFVHNVGVELALWTVGLITLTGGTRQLGWRALVSAPLVSIVVGLVLNAVEARPHVPHFVWTLLGMLGACAIPLALMLIGAVAHDHVGQARGDGARVRVPVAAVVVRLLILPALFLLGARFLLRGHHELTRVVALQAAMPAAMFPVVMTRHYGGDVGTALRVVLWTSLLSLVTAPWWIDAGLSLLR